MKLMPANGVETKKKESGIRAETERREEKNNDRAIEER